MKNELKASHVGKQYKQGSAAVSVFEDINVTFMQGTRSAITGISGCGKSTLLHLLAGIDKPSSGHVYYNQHAIDTLDTDKKNYFLNHDIGLVFQYSYLIKELSVLENVMIKGLIAKMPYEECQKRARSLLHELGLSSKVSSLPTQLSGGQQQRVAIARALLNQPAFLIADEPTGNLDEKTGRELLELLLQLQKDWGLGLIISSHDEYISEQMQQRYELANGKLVRKNA
jgi:ABC-type lipoprotein export system ATPase subunit